MVFSLGMEIAVSLLDECILDTCLKSKSNSTLIVKVDIEDPNTSANVRSPSAHATSDQLAPPTFVLVASPPLSLPFWITSLTNTTLNLHLTTAPVPVSPPTTPVPLLRTKKIRFSNRQIFQHQQSGHPRNKSHLIPKIQTQYWLACQETLQECFHQNTSVDENGKYQDMVESKCSNKPGNWFIVHRKTGPNRKNNYVVKQCRLDDM